MQPMVSQRYRLDTELGTGGTATVWLALDTVHDRPCAVKLLLPVTGPGAEARRERMRAEARAMASLDHPHVVKMLGQGEHEGRDYLVMEYAEGGSLADRLVQSGPVAPAAAAALIVQVLDALAAAHHAGIVHRDVKPANVLLRADGSVALCDFGIARLADAGGTRTGVALGSAGYMAPEQRLDARGVGPAADLYATACTLFNLVTDETPVDLYLAPDHSPRWADVPAPLRAVLRRATQADPGDRFHNATEMRDALDAVSDALKGLKSAPRRRAASGSAYEPTAVGDVALVNTGQRPLRVELDDWRRSRGQPAGRMALWVGFAAVLTLTAAGLAGRPLLDDLRERLTGGAPDPAAVEPAPPMPAWGGRWRGNLEGNRPVTLDLEGPPDALSGRLTLQLGTHLRYGQMTGAWDAEDGALILWEDPADPQALYIVVAPGPSPGILIGEMRGARDIPAMALALVWVEPLQ